MTNCATAGAGSETGDTEGKGWWSMWGDAGQGSRSTRRPGEHEIRKLLLVWPGKGVEILFFLFHPHRQRIPSMPPFACSSSQHPFSSGPALIEERSEAYQHGRREFHDGFYCRIISKQPIRR